MFSNIVSSSIQNAFTLLLASSSIFCSAEAAAPPEIFDVVVVGAGLSGLTAARDLLVGGKSVKVLEARDRVGGKVHNQQLENGGVVEIGAEFVGPTQDRVLQMIEDLGLTTFRTYNEGKSILLRNCSRTVYVPNPDQGGAPPVDPTALDQINATLAELNTWAAVSATHADADLLLTTACKAIFAVEPHEISLLYVIAYIASAGNETTKGTLLSLIAVEGGSQESRVQGGTGLIPERLAEVIGSEHITLRAAVSSVTKTAAKEVVIAMPPPLTKRITFTPALPKARQNLIDGLVIPPIGKGIAVYPTPFWRRTESLNAQVISDEGAVRVTFDSSSSNASFGAILGFIFGDEMRALDKIPPAQAQKLITEDYVRYFGPQAANTSEFVLQRWDLDEWSKGGPVAIAPPNVLKANGPALRAAVDGIHFAGTETSVYWTGYMDGAIRSGERVAKEILEK
jgi:monoamine oxidase